ncbi:Hydroxypyruvate isomerase [Caulifigura coniformis]|uniref:Hydroxypyruvate isomerase n=1 Tax=Caulifigura coniformis TaxID=2527983 RepID=A0A517SCI7_9PLAN|nr:TIM barrel protein [Caulifigura coniformis]QDT53840.1 Hydroxypyruvate isomerase [Caulifigura coniformis]
MSISTRRTWLQSTLAAGALAATPAVHGEVPGARKGRIRQSLVNWCYEKHFPSLDAFCQAAVDLGCVSIELIDPKHWPTLKKHGLTCAIAGSHGFKVGFNNRGEWDECIQKLRSRIDECVAFGVDRVITFTGMANGISKEVGADNCVEGLKKIVGYAEEKKVTLCLEHLNSRDDSHPMKGHPGYQGDHCDWCIDVLKRVGSPRLKLLFDIYHVQIMDGDVIRRLKQHKEYLGHIHTAGNPGRGELDENQEINYPAVMKTLIDIGYDGFVGQEFIPTRDALAGLKQAVAACDV